MLLRKVLTIVHIVYHSGSNILKIPGPSSDLPPPKTNPTNLGWDPNHWRCEPRSGIPSRWSLGNPRGSKRAQSWSKFAWAAESTFQMVKIVDVSVWNIISTLAAVAKSHTTNQLLGAGKILELIWLDSPWASLGMLQTLSAKYCQSINRNGRILFPDAGFPLDDICYEQNCEYT